MLSFKQLLFSAPLAVAVLGQVAFAAVTTGETCTSGPAYILFPTTGGKGQVGYCGTDPRSVARRYSTCYSTTWAEDPELNNGIASCTDPRPASSGCPEGFLYFDESTDSSAPTCTVSSCSLTGTCATACQSSGGTFANNMCTGLFFCTSDSDCPFSYQSCSPTTGRCGSACGTGTSSLGDTVPGFCYGNDFCVNPAQSLCTSCPGALSADGSCPNYVPTASRAAEARKKKRALAYLQSLLKNPDCPAGLASCPIPGSRGAFECIDVSQELSSCGGCSSEGAGEDCTTMVGVSQIGGATCVEGKCEARSCIKGFHLVGGRCI